MPHDPLLHALRDAGLVPEDLASVTEVDAKTVRRWLSGETVPHPRHRHKVAVALGVTEHEIWPDIEPQRRSPTIGDLSAVHYVNSDGNLPDWRTLAAAATERIEMFDLTLADQITSDADAEVLAVQARAGATVRVLVSSRDSMYLPLLDAELGADQAPDDPSPAVQAVDQTRTLLAPLAGLDNFHTRSLPTPRSYSILRFDDHLLVTVHAFGLHGSQAPVLLLQRRGGEGLFDHFARHFQELWQAAGR
jgi:transcriptional regulator with XRE-family HTH domain